jgi:L-histidine N-alpha-methyltransferase
VEQPLTRDVLRGLGTSPKTLPCKYFYDKRGSLLFDEICMQPEYYLTRAETDLLEAHADVVVDAMGPGATLVEPGSGSSIKTRIVLDRARTLARYVPIDISAQHLEETAQALRARYPQLEVIPQVLDYTVTPPMLEHLGPSRGKTVVFFPGSSIGNFAPTEAVRILRDMARIAGRGGLVIVGVDTPKDRRTLERAYDDEGGVTARFNLNLLERINRESAADFAIAKFRHRAVWQPEHHRIEMQLVSVEPQRVTVAETRFDFARDEAIVTEHCHKWTVDEFGALAKQAELTSTRVLFDPRSLMSMHLLEA